MDIQTALALEIGHLHQPVVTSYQLGCLIFRLYRDKVYRGETLVRISKDIPERPRYNQLVATLVKNGVLQNSKDVPNKEVFTVLGQDAAASEDIACCVDPFCYISHMSAMTYHGLTDRLPKILFLTTIPYPHWGKLAAQRMQKDLGEQETVERYCNAGLPTLRQLKLTKIHRKTVSIRASVHCDIGAYVNVHGRSLRGSTIGRTFLDMIRNPDLCGGIYHVLEIYSTYARRYLRLIVDEIDRHGKKIDKVRVGYILDERLGLSHPIIDTWLTFVQRGSSQKLHASTAYSAHFSEKWCLSINIDEVEED
jgi:predicted transcriptional regulator of viral defense system